MLLLTTKWSWKPLFPGRYFTAWALLTVLVATVTDTVAHRKRDRIGTMKVKDKK